MLIHRWDAAARQRWGPLLEGGPFGQLITAGRVDGYPVVVPTHFGYDGDRTVFLHLARPNPVWQAIAADPAVVIAVVADYAYVEAEWNAPPEWGAEARAELGVPTSYYSAVQLRGRAVVLDHPEEKAAVLRSQLAGLEPPGSRRRPPSPAIEEDRRQLPGIRALRVEVLEVLAKMKYGGNRPEEHRSDIATHLERRGGLHDGAAARRVREGLRGAAPTDGHDRVDGSMREG